MKNKIELTKKFFLGRENIVHVGIYGMNLKSEKPAYSFTLKFPNGIEYKASENGGGFNYDTQEDAIDAALDFLVDHAVFYKIGQKATMKKFQYDADLSGELDNYEENPEDNIEEVPEDFRISLC